MPYFGPLELAAGLVLQKKWVSYISGAFFDLVAAGNSNFPETMMRAGRVACWITVLLSLACGDGGGAGGGRVTAPPAAQTVTTVNVTLSSSTVEIGGTVTASAAVLDQNSSPIAGKTVTWSSDNDAIATVNSSGVVTGVTNGTVNIVGTVEGKQGKAAGTVVTSSKWVLDGVVLNNATYGGASGALADVTVVKLNDGRYRMWLGAIPGTAIGIFSAISADGLRFTPESGIRIPAPITMSPGAAPVRLSHPFVMRLDDGRLRLYAHSAPTPDGRESGMYSLTSTDEGVTFTPDPGLRFTAADAGVPGKGLVGGGIVKAKTGGYRMYFSASSPDSSAPTPGGNFLTKDVIKSAFSTDLLTWTVDPGVRIGEGSTLTGNGVHPGAIANDDGSITLVYFRNRNVTTYFSTSADGLSFTTEASTGFSQATGPASDTFLMRLPNGDVRMFYNWGNDIIGVIYVAHRRGFSLGGP